MLERHGWTLHAHPLFLDQVERLLTVVERAKRSDPDTWQGKADTKLLAALRALILDWVPRDPLAAEFRQGQGASALVSGQVRRQPLPPFLPR